MKITTITVTYGRKINLGNYNNANLEVTLGADLEENDDLRLQMEILWETAKESVKAQVAHLIEASKPKEKGDF